MLGGILATLLICLGVANTTPICKYAEEKTAHKIQPKKANETSYQLDLSFTNTTNLFQNNLLSNTRMTKSQISGGNQAINVIGTVYNQTAYSQENNITTTYYAMSVSDVTRQYTCECMYVFQITPYNINRETKIRIKLNINVPYVQGNLSIGANRVIYSATDNNFAQYVNQQLVLNQPLRIKQDIEDINNGFYYTKDVTSQTIEPIGGTGSYQANWYNEFEITLVPEINNYFVIDYVPYVLNAEEQDQYGRVALENGWFMYENYVRITGTNILPGNYEVVDIPGLMFEVISMPFAFVSQAFNLTLFPGTPYQINIANLFLSIMAVFVFVWIITIIIKIKAGGR